MGLYHDQLLRLTARALASGAERVNQYRTRWDVAGNCEAPVVREVWARPTHKSGQRAMIEVSRSSSTPLLLEMHLRCRKCAKCLRSRQMEWTYRARTETMFWPRTWFTTLTLRPDRQFHYLARARAKCDAQGVDFESLSSDERFRLHHEEVEKEITKYLKRVRKQSRAKLRYILSCEVHTKELTGMPHYHMLIHECDNLHSLKHRILTAQWADGFSYHKLVNLDLEPNKAVFYVCKYLTKSNVARVRASLRYGLKNQMPA